MSYSSPYYSRTYGYTKPNPPIGSSGGPPGSDRPSTLNLPNNPNTSQMPSKPSRYTPTLPTIQSQPKSSSYTNIPAASATGPQSSAGGYSYTSSRRIQDVITVPPKSIGNLGGYGRPDPMASVPYYQTQMTSLRPGQSGGGGMVQGQPGSSMNMSMGGGSVGSGVTTSKSTHNLMDSIPDVFCLSCPPAEFKFSDAYRAKTLPRTGKEVSHNAAFLKSIFTNF